MKGKCTLVVVRQLFFQILFIVHSDATLVLCKGLIVEPHHLQLGSLLVLNRRTGPGSVFGSGSLKLGHELFVARVNERTLCPVVRLLVVRLYLIHLLARVVSSERWQIIPESFLLLYLLIIHGF